MKINYQYLKQAGFDDAQIQQALRPKLEAAGFDETSINQYFQNQSGQRPLSLAGEEQNGGIKALAAAADEAAAQSRQQGVNLGFKDAIRLGWEQSVVGMLKRGKEPRPLTQEEEESLNFLERMAMGLSGFVSDAPVYFVGGKMGAAAGGAAGAAVGSVAPGVGTAAGGTVGAAVGGASGAFGFQRAARQALIDLYRRGEVASWDELIYRVKNASKEFGKGAVEGTVMAAAGAAGGVGAKAVLGAAAGRTGAGALALKATAKTLPTGSEVLGLTAASSAVEGRVPTVQDFADNAGMILGLKGMNKVSGAAFNRMRNKVVDTLYERFIERGEAPSEAIQKIMQDPVELQKVLAEEQRQIMRGAAEVQAHPERGNFTGKFDVLATFSNNLKTFIINRGAAIINAKGEVVVRGRELQRQTGTARNFGFSKMIFGKGMTAEQMAQLPLLVRQYKPVEVTEKAEIYRIANEGSLPYKIVFTKEAVGPGKNFLAHMSLDPRSVGMKMSERRGPESQTPALIQGNGYADASPIETSGPNLSINNIQQKDSSVKGPFQSLGGGDYGRQFTAGTQIPVGEKAVLPQGQVRAQDAVKKSQIIGELVRAAGVPVRQKGARFGKAAGLFYPKEEMIRVKKANDLTTVAHEIGHYLEKSLFGKVGSKEISEYHGELSKLATKPRGNPSKNKVAAEGFAEFIASYVADPQKARESAPRFYAFFEKELAAKDPQMREALQRAREETDKWARQPAVMEVLSHISTGPEAGARLTAAEKWQAVKNKIAEQIFDDKAPLRRVVQRLEEKTGVKIDWAKNPYIMARLFPGWAGRAEAFVQNGAFDFNTLQKTGKSLQEILRPVENLDELRAYLVSKRAVELADRAAAERRLAASEGREADQARIIETGVREEAARAVVKELEGKYGPVARELYAFQDALLKYQLDGQLISRETYDRVRAENKAHVPFYRVLDNKGDYALGSRSMGSKQVLKRMKGSTRDIVDPLEGILKDVYATVNAVERNRVGLALADLAQVEGAGEFVFKVPQDMKAVHTTTGETVFQPSAAIDKANQIKVFRKGKAEIYEVDPDVAKIVNGLNGSDAGMLVRGLGFFAKSLRAGATGLNATFSIKNFLRDTMFAYLTSTSGFNPLKSFPGNVKMALGKNEAYWQFMKAGGGMSSFVSMDRKVMQENLRALERTGYTKAVWNAVSGKRFAEAVDVGLLSPVRWVSETSELITRLGEFKSSMRGKEFTKENLEKAGFNAREVTLDFAKGGVASKYLNTMTAFFNASVQGFAKTGDILSSRPRAVKAVAFLGTLGVLEALYNYDWKKGKEDEDIAEVVQAQKNINFVFKIGDVIFRVPKPQQIGFIATFFSQMTTAALDKLNKNEREGVVQNLAQAFFNEFDLNPVPTGLAVPAELYFNRSLFFDRPIVPAAAENVLPEYQYGDYTSELAKAVSAKLGGWIGKENTFSPAKAEYMVRGWMGGVGSFILQATDAALRKAGVLPDPVRPADTLSDVPFVKAFVVRHPSGSAESIQKFYTAYNRSIKRYNSFKLEGKRQNFQSQQDLSVYAPYAGLNRIYTAMGQQSAAIRNIYNNPNLSADEKRQLIDRLYLAKIQFAKQGLEVIKQMDETVESLQRAGKNRQ